MLIISFTMVKRHRVDTGLVHIILLGGLIGHLVFHQLLEETLVFKTLLQIGIESILDLIVSPTVHVLCHLGPARLVFEI